MVKGTTWIQKVWALLFSIRKSCNDVSISSHFVSLFCSCIKLNAKWAVKLMLSPLVHPPRWSYKSTVAIKWYYEARLVMDSWKANFSTCMLKNRKTTAQKLCTTVSSHSIELICWTVEIKIVSIALKLFTIKIICQRLTGKSGLIYCSSFVRSWSEGVSAARTQPWNNTEYKRVRRNTRKTHNSHDSPVLGIRLSVNI